MQIQPLQPSSPADQQTAPPRPEIGPEHNLWRRQIEAVLFGGSDELAFGRYRLLHRIGEGGMGSVYAAYDEELERKIAVKLIRPSRLDSAELRERTLREARALARLSHPHVVHVYEVGEVEGQLFVAMEFLAGPTLRAWLDAERRPWREVLHAFAQAGEGLAAAHAQGIIHRDFKPHNAMFGADARVRVLDFGLARLGELERSQLETTLTDLPSEGLTITGALLGTPAYMAPEQLVTGQASSLSDQFSFCVALFEALYGHRPFRGETLEALMTELTSDRGALRPRDTDVPRWLHAVLLRGLAVDPGARWPSMRELLIALRRDPRARNRRILAGALLVGLTGALSFALARPSEPPLDVCPDARDEIAAVWGETRAAEIAASVRAKHGARADPVLAIVVPQLDRYVDQWAELRNEACRAHARGQQSANVFDARTACLDERLASVEALVQILDSESAEQFDGAAQAASGLPALERCADVAALLDAIPPPEDAATRARVQAHRETLARAQVHGDAGQYQRGIELVAEVLADEEALAHQPLLAEAYLRKGDLEMMLDPVESERSLSRALWVALELGHASVAAVASSKRGFLHGAVLDQHPRAMNDLPMITALNRRVVDDVGLYAEYLNNVGNIHMTVEDVHEARRWLEEARDLRSASGQRMDWRGLATINNLGAIALLERDNVEAYATFHAIVRASAAVVPSTHIMNVAFALGRVSALANAGRPRAAIAEARTYLEGFEGIESYADTHAHLHDHIGAYFRDIGDPDTAREYFDAGVAIQPDLWILRVGVMLNAAAMGDTIGVQTHYEHLTNVLAGQIPLILIYVDQQYGRALIELGELDQAVTVLEQARARIGELTTLGHARLSADVTFDLGEARRKLGDYDAAERELERALADTFAWFTRVGPTHAHILRELGELALARGRFDEARTQLEQVVSIYLASVEPDYLPLGRARFALARALTGDRERTSPEARTLAEAALLSFRANGKHDDARRVETWLAEHPTDY